MEISSSTSIPPMRPFEPQTPTTPAGGNIENRQPPTEPSASTETELATQRPNPSEETSGLGTNGSGNTGYGIDLYA